MQWDGVITALDHAKIAEGTGGSGQMVPGQHHVRMNMFLAQVSYSKPNVVKGPGAIDPKACVPAGK